MSTLDQLKPGVKAKIKKIHESRSAQRMMEMGILEGSTVQVKCEGLCGDPIGIEVRGAIIGLRKALARQVEVEIE